MHFHMIFFLQLLSITGASDSGITGGRPVKPNSRPYMVSLQVGGHHVCGGVLIRKDFVLTSAHCKGSKPMIVVLGTHNISKKENKTRQRIPVAEYYPHPDHDHHRFDIMLLKLKTNAALTKYVKIIELPKKDGKVPANIKCSIAGWGMTAPNTLASNILREVTVKMQFSFECANRWKQFFSEDQMLCTRSDGRKGICQVT
ncbi:granzyme B(G,H)-like [Aplochiton taeniatus]